MYIVLIICIAVRMKYNKISDKMMDSGSCWIEEIEDMEEFLPNELIHWAEKEAEDLDMIQ